MDFCWKISRKLKKKCFGKQFFWGDLERHLPLLSWRFTPFGQFFDVFLKCFVWILCLWMGQWWFSLRNWRGLVIFDFYCVLFERFWVFAEGVHENWIFLKDCLGILVLHVTYLSRYHAFYWKDWCFLVFFLWILSSVGCAWSMLLLFQWVLVEKLVGFG